MSGLKSYAPALRRLERLADQVAERVLRHGELNDRRLREEIAGARVALRRAGGSRAGDDTALQEATALLVIACERELPGSRPSPGQVLAALAMRAGYAVEPDPRDGRTLAVGMAAVLHAWSGHPCHVVTASEHVARRDALRLQPLFALCGCGVAALAQDTPAEQVAGLYGVDILYATGRQLLSDFMRGHLVFGKDSGSLRRRLGELHARSEAQGISVKGAVVAIVDDAGAVLIDDATSAVVISAPGKSSVLEEVTQIAKALVDDFEPGRDYVLGKKASPTVRWTAEGEQRLEARTPELPAFWRHEKRSEDAIKLAILARDVLVRDRHYAIQQQRVVVLDDGVNRLTAGYSWYFGVTQAIEAREGLPLTIPPRTLARTTFQEFFPRYHRLSGAGVALQGLGRELRRTYGLRLLRLPALARPKAEVVARYGFTGRKDKMDALIESAGRFHRDRLPVLVGVRGVQDAVEIVSRLAESGVECSVLDGKDPEADEKALAMLRAQGGVAVVPGAAARGPGPGAGVGRTAAGGVQLMLHERHELKRADQVFIAWAGCLGAPDRVHFFASLEDDLLTRCPRLWAAPLRLLSRWPAFRHPCVAALVHLSQWAVRRQGSRYRRLLLRREEMLDQQLSFFSKLHQDSGSRF